jgi:alpha-galactosidase
MKATADYLHARGLKFGLYTDAGLFTCNQGHRPYKIPGSYGHYEQDALTYASWGMGEGKRLRVCVRTIAVR